MGLIRDGKPLEVEVTVAEGREETREARNTAPEVEKNFGLVVQNITPEIAHHLNLKDTRGVIVTDIQQRKPCRRRGRQGRRHHQGDKQESLSGTWTISGRYWARPAKGRDRHAGEEGEHHLLRCHKGRNGQPVRESERKRGKDAGIRMGRQEHEGELKKGMLSADSVEQLRVLVRRDGIFLTQAERKERSAERQRRGDRARR